MIRPAAVCEGPRHRGHATANVPEFAFERVTLIGRDVPDASLWL